MQARASMEGGNRTRAEASRGIRARCNALRATAPQLKERTDASYRRGVVLSCQSHRKKAPAVTRARRGVSGAIDASAREEAEPSEQEEPRTVGAGSACRGMGHRVWGSPWLLTDGVKPFRGTGEGGPSCLSAHAHAYTAAIGKGARQEARARNKITKLPSGTVRGPDREGAGGKPCVYGPAGKDPAPVTFGGVYRAVSGIQGILLSLNLYLFTCSGRFRKKGISGAFGKGAPLATGGGSLRWDVTQPKRPRLPPPPRRGQRHRACCVYILRGLLLGTNGDKLRCDPL